MVSALVLVEVGDGKVGFAINALGEEKNIMEK